MIEKVGRQAGITGPPKARGIRTVRDDADDRGVEGAVDGGLMDCREIRSAAREKNGELHSIQLAKPDGGASYCTRPLPRTMLPMKKYG